MKRHYSIHYVFQDWLHWLTLPPILIRFALRLAVSEIQHVQGQRKSEMHRMTQTELEDLTDKSTLYTLRTYPEGPNFGPFRSKS